jgi:hypothetical protein
LGTEFWSGPVTPVGPVEVVRLGDGESDGASESEGAGETLGESEGAGDWDGSGDTLEEGLPLGAGESDGATVSVGVGEGVTSSASTTAADSCQPTNRPTIAVEMDFLYFTCVTSLLFV